jgi:NDP-sugar pyrophosphorylase family protein
LLEDNTLAAMILAAGEGTRLRPYTLTMPKPMLPVAGRPTLEWILLWLRHYGICDVAINLCHQPDPVLSCFGDGQRLGVQLAFSVEPVILGTAGGLKRLERHFTGTFVVVYGDVLTDLDLGALIAFHRSNAGVPHVTLSVNHAPNPWECGIVAVDVGGRVTRFVEKPPRNEVFSDLTNAGVLVVDPAILAHIPAQGFSDISRDLLPALLQAGVPIFAKPLDDREYLIDMGTPEKYEQAQREWPTEGASLCLKAQQ